jgi:hypothetical protein
VNNKKLEFFTSDDSLEPLKPSKMYVPEWYRSTKTPNYSKIEFNEFGNPDKNFKSCIPFLDSFISGYIVESDRDIHVSTTLTGDKSLRWTNAINDHEPLSERKEKTGNLPVPAGHSNTPFVWHNRYMFRAPVGYSLIISHPMNRFDLPFTTLSAIVDVDSLMGEGNIPFFLKQNFEGTIHAGTPLFQIIPFKRESWVAESNKELEAIYIKQNKKNSRKFFNFYKTNLWHKKEYN